MKYTISTKNSEELPTQDKTNFTTACYYSQLAAVRRFCKTFWVKLCFDYLQIVFYKHFLHRWIYLKIFYDTLEIRFVFNEKVVGEINDDKLRVRKEPRIGEVLGHVNKGDRVIILGKSENKDTIDNFNDYWYKIMFDGIEGWVYGGYVDIEEEKVSLLSIFMGT